MKKFHIFLIGLAIVLISLGWKYRTASAGVQNVSAVSGYSLPWINLAKLAQDGYGSGHLNQVDFIIEDGGNFVTAAKDGVVIFAKYSSERSSCLSTDEEYANMVVISHGADTNPGEFSWYLHLAHTDPYVHVGDSVTTGQIIGVQGNTGWMNTSSCYPPAPTPTPPPGFNPPTGHHLHFMVSTWHTLIENMENPSASDAIWPIGRVAVDFVEVPWSSLIYTSPPTVYRSKDKVVFYTDQSFGGGQKDFDWPGEEYNMVTNNFDNVTRSIKIWPGWSIKVAEGAWGSDSVCLNGGDYPNLSIMAYPETNISLDGSISYVWTYPHLDCDGTAPPVICSSSIAARGMMGVAALDDSCLPPTSPTPTPHPGVTPTPPPPPQTGVWNAKVFSFLNECNDSPNCSPTSTYFQTSISGTNFNLNFADGKAFGVGGDQWGAFFQQTINFSPGTYYFHADHDDGVKIWVNGWISCEYMYLSISLEFSNI